MEYLLQIRAENVLIQQVIELFLFSNMDIYGSSQIQCQTTGVQVSSSNAYLEHWKLQIWIPHKVPGLSFFFFFF